MQMITPILLIVIVLVGLLFFTSTKESTEQIISPPIYSPLIEYLKVIKCSGGMECSMTEYTTEASTITGQVVLPAQARKSHVIGKGQTGNVVISDITQNREIKGVFLDFRYFGEKDISGSWTIQFKNDALTETYCIYSLPLLDRINYNEVDITGCNWDKNKLDNLTIQLMNGDVGYPQEAFVSSILIKIVYDAKIRGIAETIK